MAPIPRTVEARVFPHDLLGTPAPQPCSLFSRITLPAPLCSHCSSHSGLLAALLLPQGLCACYSLCLEKSLHSCILDLFLRCSNVVLSKRHPAQLVEGDLVGFDLTATLQHTRHYPHSTDGPTRALTVWVTARRGCKKNLTLCLTPWRRLSALVDSREMFLGSLFGSISSPGEVPSPVCIGRHRSCPIPGGKRGAHAPMVESQ